jgi:hypothetical protein
LVCRELFSIIILANGCFFGGSEVVLTSPDILLFSSTKEGEGSAFSHFTRVAEKYRQMRLRTYLHTLAEANKRVQAK